MSFKRGAIVTIAAGEGFGGKPRPALIISTDELSDYSTVIVLPFTTEFEPMRPVRPRIMPTPENGLKRQCGLMVDVPITLPRAKVGKTVGHLSPDDLLRVESALLFALGFGNDRQQSMH